MLLRSGLTDRLGTTKFDNQRPQGGWGHEAPSERLTESADEKRRGVAHD